MIDILEYIQIFLDKGGQVLWFILAVLVILWTLVFERLSFFKHLAPAKVKVLQENWSLRHERSSWQAHKIRELMISEASIEARKYIGTIKTLVALCPLLGLLGTVTGMIAVFEVMAVTGTGNARLMASGISMATIPTMAGMVAALSGLYFSAMLEKRAKTFSDQVTEALVFE